ncbi:substrate-binding domain-containing protein [bacterium]|nr:substrate-binding domain-containing protein [bacterium]
MPAQIDKNASLPIYRQIYEWYRGRILDGTLTEGDCMPSIRQMQRDLGVARESVKRALNDLAADGFVRKIQGKGTFVARREVQRCFWGVVVPFYAEFYNQAIVELRRVASREGIVIEHACDYDDWKRQVEIVREFTWRQAEAVIIVPSRHESKSLSHYQKLSRNHLLILFDRSSIASQLPYVIQDYVLAVNLALEQMVAAGARRIIYVRDPLWPRGNPIYRTMEQAYSQFCADLPEPYERYFDSPHEISERDLRLPDFDGVFCVNDQIACLVVGLLHEHGIPVPGRVQVAGNNNAEVGRFFTPQITTTCPDLPRMCRLITDMIQRHKDGEPVELLQHVIIPRLEQRETTREAVQFQEGTVHMKDAL